MSPLGWGASKIPGAILRTPHQDGTRPSAFGRQGRHDGATGQIGAHVRQPGQRATSPELQKFSSVAWVECRGCFWHLCPEDAVLPKSNLDYWLPKLERNVERDRQNERALAEAGWTLVVVWEHEDIGESACHIERLVRAALASPATDRRSSVYKGRTAT